MRLAEDPLLAEVERAVVAVEISSCAYARAHDAGVRGDILERLRTDVIAAGRRLNAAVDAHSWVTRVEYEGAPW